MSKPRPHVPRDQMLSQRKTPRMVGVWDKSKVEAVTYSDGTVHRRDAETGAIKRVTPKPYSSKADRRAKIKERRAFREAAAFAAKVAEEANAAQ